MNILKRLLLTLALACTLSVPAYAADTKISAMTAGSAPAGTEKIPAVQGAANVYLTPSQLSTFTIGNIPTLVGDSGSGGTKGYAPAPAAGDAAAGKYLSAGGTWSVPAGGGSGTATHPGYVATRWYQAASSRSVTGVAVTTNTIALYPYIFPQTMTISDLGVKVTTSGASTNARLTLYAASSSTKKPTSTALSSCTVATTSTGVLTCTLGSTVQVTAGTVYWIGAQFDNSTVLFTCVDSQAGARTVQDMIGTTTATNLLGSGTWSGYTATATYASGAPDLTSATFTETTTLTIPLQIFKVTSVP